MKYIVFSLLLTVVTGCKFYTTCGSCIVNKCTYIQRKDFSYGCISWGEYKKTPARRTFRTLQRCRILFIANSTQQITTIAPLRKLILETSLPTVQPTPTTYVLKRMSSTFPSILPPPFTLYTTRFPTTIPTTSIPPPSTIPTTSIPTPGTIPTTSIPPPSTIPTTSIPPPSTIPTTSIPTPGTIPTTSIPPPSTIPTTSIPTPGIIPTTLIPLPRTLPITSTPPPSTIPTTSLPPPTSTLFPLTPATTLLPNPTTAFPTTIFPSPTILSTTHPTTAATRITSSTTVLLPVPTSIVLASNNTLTTFQALLPITTPITFLESSLNATKVDSSATLQTNETIDGEVISKVQSLPQKNRKRPSLSPDQLDKKISSDLRQALRRFRIGKLPLTEKKLRREIQRLLCRLAYVFIIHNQPWTLGDKYMKMYVNNPMITKTGISPTCKKFRNIKF